MNSLLVCNPRRTLEDIVAAQRAVIALTDYFPDEVARRRLQKGNDLISLLLEIEEDGEVLTAELRARPEMIRSAIEELLRYESPVQYTGQIAREEMHDRDHPWRREP
jgi:cytochrome P450